MVSFYTFPSMIYFYYFVMPYTLTSLMSGERKYINPSSTEK